MNERIDEPIFVISVAAKMIGVHAQTLRYYERAGLVDPSRSDGNRRYYSQRDLERLKQIKTLIVDLGVNLAGAEIALKLMDKIEKLEDSMSQMRYQLNMIESRSNPRALSDGTNSTQN